MEPTVKDIVIGKIREMPEEQVAKVLIFIAGLEAGSQIPDKLTSKELEDTVGGVKYAL